MATKDASVDLVSIWCRLRKSVALKMVICFTTNNSCLTETQPAAINSHVRLAQFPENPCSFSVAVEAKERIDLTPVEPIDRVVQPGRRVDVMRNGQRILDVLSPAFFFEHAENCLLIPRWYTEPLHDQSRQRELPPNRIPARFHLRVRSRAGYGRLPGTRQRRASVHHSCQRGQRCLWGSTRPPKHVLGKGSP